MSTSLKIFKQLTALAVVSLAMVGCDGGPSGVESVAVEPFWAVTEPDKEWQLVWSDEFDGDAVDTSVWSYQEGDGTDYGFVEPGWGNREHQFYTDRNATVADGILTVDILPETTQSTYTNDKGVEVASTANYTSTRMRTMGNLEVKYGRIEARIKAPAGQGIWSAFWMLPTDSPYGDTWAAFGEIDIMEVINAGTEGQDVIGTLHFGFDWPLNLFTGDDASHAVEDPSDGFHVYAVEWDEQKIRWYIDDVHYSTIYSNHWFSYFYDSQENGYMSGGPAAPFDSPFHLILNVAVGGNLPGDPDPSAIPTKMEVDYVRVYKCAYDLPNGTGCNVNADRSVDGADDRAPSPSAPYSTSYDLYVDSPGPLVAGIITRPMDIYSEDNDGALTFSQVEADDPSHGMVIDIETSDSGNISLSAHALNRDTEEIADDILLDEQGDPVIDTVELYGVGNNPLWFRSGAGELKFDLYIDSANTDPESSLLVKMTSEGSGSGFVELAVADLPSDEWTSVSVKVNDLLHPDNQGDIRLDTELVLGLFVLEPTSFAHVQIDNIQFACGHPSVRGCGVRPPGFELDASLVTIFDDVLAAEFDEGFGGWDSARLPFNDYFSPSSGNHVTWSVKDAADPERGQIIEANFGTNGLNGVFFMRSTLGFDLSGYVAEGKLIFDVKLDAGSSHGLTFKIDCFQFCGTHDVEVDLTDHVRGEWNTIEIPLLSLVGLSPPNEGVIDFSKVSAVVFFPTWGDQQGRTIQLDNIRFENPAGATGIIEDLKGTWQLAPEAAALKLGVESGSTAWWASTENDLTTRDCLFDDEYIFDGEGNFTNVHGADTWVELWQTGSIAACGAPVAPHDGLTPGTFVHDTEADTLVLTGVGSYVGVPKVHNNGDLTSPGDAPASITYDVTFLDMDTILVGIRTGQDEYWTMKLIRTEEYEAPPAITGRWRARPFPGLSPISMHSPDWSQLWTGLGFWDANYVTNRACWMDDEYVFGADGSFTNVYGADTWVEIWQGGADACGTPVAPYDGSTSATYTDNGDGTLTLNGTGAHFSWPKLSTDGFFLDVPGAVIPASITYNWAFPDGNENLLNVHIDISTDAATANGDAGSAGAHWLLVLERIVD